MVIQVRVGRQVSREASKKWMTSVTLDTVYRVQCSSRSLSELCFPGQSMSCLGCTDDDYLTNSASRLIRTLVAA